MHANHNPSHRAPPPGDPAPAECPFAVLYEDDDLLAVDKPAGLVAHPAYRHPDGTLYDAIVARQTARGEARPWLLHRLDRDTTGVVLLAKTVPARRALVRQFEQRNVHKWYLALVSGCPTTASDTITQPLRRDPLDRRRVVVDPAGQPAETRYRVLAADTARALLLAEPRTGRTHQIRAHLAWLGHPLLGDPTYADASASTAPGAPARHLLHAWALAVRHPASGAPLHLVAPLPADLAAHLPDAWRAALPDPGTILNATTVASVASVASGAPPAPQFNEEASHASLQH
jgi:23S rRNA pseudouridine1911/1915/1917 synthase